MTEQQFGRYQIIRELGRGGMATVYLAHDPQLNRQVALKVLPREFLHDPEFLERFKREARTAALDHMAIVPVYDFGEADGQPFIVMKLMAGGSLEDRVGQGMSVSTALPILDRLAQALDYAHSKGVIHRDLKPGNVLFDETGNAFLSDFGIARAMETGTGMTRGVIGTPFYMSPEQINGSALDGRSDQYTLGVVAYELLTGSRPFGGQSPQSLYKQHLLDTPPLLQQAHPHLPGALDAPLQRALAKDPTERFPSCTAFADALARAARHPQAVGAGPVTLLDTGHVMPMMPKPIQPSHVPNLPVLLAVGGGVVALVLVGLVVGGVVLADNLLGTASTDPNLTAAVQSQGNPATSTPEPPTATVEPSATPPPPTATEPPPTITPDAYSALLELASSPVSRNESWEPIAWIFDDDSTGATMMLVPPGCFEMGSMTGDSTEQPVAEQCLSEPFWLDELEITNADFGSAGCSEHSFSSDQPRNCVSWYQAREYCKSRNARLPTELEWEYAAAGPSDWIYPWGNTWNGANLSWRENASGVASRVGEYPGGASWVGVLDMSGNLEEWTSTLWADLPYSLTDGRESPNGDGSRVIRGGSFKRTAEDLRTTFRNWGLPGNTDFSGVGFRCARDP